MPLSLLFQRNVGGSFGWRECHAPATSIVFVWRKLCGFGFQRVLLSFYFCVYAVHCRFCVNKKVSSVFTISFVGRHLRFMGALAVGECWASSLSFCHLNMHMYLEVCEMSLCEPKRQECERIGFVPLRFGKPIAYH